MHGSLDDKHQKIIESDNVQTSTPNIDWFDWYTRKERAHNDSGSEGSDR